MQFLSPDHRWLKYRIRFILGCIFLLSLFIHPYDNHDEEIAVPQDIESFDSHQFLIADDGFLMKTSSLTEEGTRSAFTRGILHTVESGESIASIAKQFGLTQDTIRSANTIGKNDSLKPGQVLLILPVDGVLHTVKRGQNLQSIAELYNVDTTLIARQNDIRKGYLFAGQQLIIPGGKPIVVAIKPPTQTTKPPAKEPGKKPTTPATPTSSVEIAKDSKGFNMPVSSGVFQMPCDCFYTQYFSRVHFGVDLQHRGGSPIYAAEAGVVERADFGWNGGYGNVVVINHGNGMKTLYAHNKKIYVKIGQRVGRGETIAFMGNTGRVHGPTGIHLHFEVHVNGMKKNPLMYIR